MGLFHAQISVRIRIDGCPESGIPALEYRRAHGLAERLDDSADAKINGEISEAEFRALVAAGWKASDRDGAQVIHFCGLEREYDPTSSYGHAAVIPVSATDTATELACRALVLCAAQESAWVAEKREKQRKEAAEYADTYVASDIDQRLSQRASRPWGEDISHNLLDEPLRSKYEQALADTERAVAERKASEAAADKARKAAYDAERAAWIAEHGSQRIKRLAAEGLGLNETYKNERIAAERPGWEYLDLVCGYEETTRDATEEALSALDEARKVAPDAKLGWLGNGTHCKNCEHEDNEFGEPGEKFEAGIALFADFIGDRIVKLIKE
jgi:hypothetical protein